MLAQEDGIYTYQNQLDVRKLLASVSQIGEEQLLYSLT
jgi:hypothetical protein